MSAPSESIPAMVRIIRGTLRLLRPRLVAAEPRTVIQAEASDAG